MKVADHVDELLQMRIPGPNMESPPLIADGHPVRDVLAFLRSSFGGLEAQERFLFMNPRPWGLEVVVPVIVFLTKRLLIEVKPDRSIAHALADIERLEITGQHRGAPSQGWALTLNPHKAPGHPESLLRWQAVVPDIAQASRDAEREGLVRQDFEAFKRLCSALASVVGGVSSASAVE